MSELFIAFLICLFLALFAAVLLKFSPGCSGGLLIAWDLLLVMSSCTSSSMGWDISMTIAAIAPWILMGLFMLLFDYFKDERVEERAFKASEFYDRYKDNFKSDKPSEIFSELKEDPGLYGEYLVFKELNQLPGEKKFLFSLVTPDGDDPYGQETDIVMFWNNCIYIIEAKNLSGEVYTNYNSNTWMHREEKIHSPEHQNHQHELSIMNVLREKDLYPSWNSCVLFTEVSTFYDVSNDYPYNVKYNNIGNFVAHAKEFRIDRTKQPYEKELNEDILNCYEFLNSLPKYSREEMQNGKARQRLRAETGESNKHPINYYLSDNTLFRTNKLYWEILADRGGEKLKDDNWRWMLSTEPSEKTRLQTDDNDIYMGQMNDEVNYAYKKIKLQEPIGINGQDT